MGLLFALQPFDAKSTPTRLHLRSHFRKFAMGGSLVFAGLFLGVMTLAAFPLFRVMYDEGGFFDQLIVGFFILALIVYPILAAGCFLFEEHLIIERRPDKTFDLRGFKSVLFFKWAKKEHKGFILEEFQEENWVGALNAAAIKANKKAKPNRYATKGHWMLVLKRGDETVVIERRAKKEEIEWLKFLISKHFHRVPSPA